MINQFGTFRCASEKRDSRSKREGTIKRQNESSVKQRGRGSQRKAQPKSNAHQTQNLTKRITNNTKYAHITNYSCALCARPLFLSFSLTRSLSTALCVEWQIIVIRFKFAVGFAFDFSTLIRISFVLPYAAFISLSYLSRTLLFALSRSFN